MSELQQLDFDLNLTGFSPDDLLRLFDSNGTQPLVDPDEVPKPPDDPITQTGDLWVLGEHRLLCGDAGKAEDVDRLLGGASIQLVNTDPPYNVRVEPSSNNAIAAGLSSFEPMTRHPKRGDSRPRPKAKTPPQQLRAKDRPLANDFVATEEFERLLQAWFRNIARVLQPGGTFYLWGGYAQLRELPAGAEGLRALLHPIDHLGKRAPGPDART